MAGVTYPKATWIDDGPVLVLQFGPDPDDIKQLKSEFPHPLVTVDRVDGIVQKVVLVGSAARTARDAVKETS